MLKFCVTLAISNLVYIKAGNVASHVKKVHIVPYTSKTNLSKQTEIDVAEKMILMKENSLEKIPYTHPNERNLLLNMQIFSGEGPTLTDIHRSCSIDPEKLTENLEKILYRNLKAGTEFARKYTKYPDPRPYSPTEQYNLSKKYRISLEWVDSLKKGLPNIPKTLELRILAIKNERVHKHFEDIRKNTPIFDILSDIAKGKTGFDNAKLFELSDGNYILAVYSNSIPYRRNPISPVWRDISNDIIDFIPLGWDKHLNNFMQVTDRQLKQISSVTERAVKEIMKDNELKEFHNFNTFLDFGDSDYLNWKVSFFNYGFIPNSNFKSIVIPDKIREKLSWAKDPNEVAKLKEHNFNLTHNPSTADEIIEKIRTFRDPLVEEAKEEFKEAYNRLKRRRDSLTDEPLTKEQTRNVYETVKGSIYFSLNLNDKELKLNSEKSELLYNLFHSDSFYRFLQYKLRNKQKEFMDHILPHLSEGAYSKSDKQEKTEKSIHKVNQKTNDKANKVNDVNRDTETQAPLSELGDSEDLASEDDGLEDHESEYLALKDDKSEDASVENLQLEENTKNKNKKDQEIGSIQKTSQTLQTQDKMQGLGKLESTQNIGSKKGSKKVSTELSNDFLADLKKSKTEGIFAKFKLILLNPISTIRYLWRYLWKALWG